MDIPVQADVLFATMPVRVEMRVTTGMIRVQRWPVVNVQVDLLRRCRCVSG